MSREPKPRSPRTLCVAMVSACAMLALAPAAQAAKSDRIIDDCASDGRLNGSYSQRELREALKHLPTDIDEYTNCRSAIRRAFGGSGGAGGGPTGFGESLPGGIDPAAPPTPEELDRFDRAIEEGGEPVPLSAGDVPVRPGAQPASTSNPLPTALLVGMLGLTGIGIAAAIARGRPQLVKAGQWLADAPANMRVPHAVRELPYTARNIADRVANLFRR